MEKQFLHRMLKCSYMDRVTSEEVLKRAQTKRSLMNDTRKRQSTFFGHVMRQKAMKHLVTTGKIEGRRSREIGVLNFLG